MIYSSAPWSAEYSEVVVVEPKTFLLGWYLTKSIQMNSLSLTEPTSSSAEWDKFNLKIGPCLQEKTDFKRWSLLRFTCSLLIYFFRKQVLKRGGTAGRTSRIISSNWIQAPTTIIIWTAYFHSSRLTKFASTHNYIRSKYMFKKLRFSHLLNCLKSSEYIPHKFVVIYFQC